MKLRPYQARGKRDIFEGWKETNAIFYVCPTGGGKTVTFVEVIKEVMLEGARCMLIAHREELIYQAHATLYANKIFAGIIKAGDPEAFHLPCQVGSVQTLIRRKKLPHADVIIVDEAHHVTDSNSYGKIFAQYPFAKILMVSATPYRLSGEGFENIIPGHKTKLIVNSTLKSLTEDGWLAPLRYFVPSIPDLSDVHLRGGDYNEEEAKKAMELAPLVPSYLEFANGTQFICFAITVQHSKDICAAFWNSGIPCAHLDADTPKDERQEILRLFRLGFYTGLVNVGILTEGADFPMAVTGILARPTKALSLYLQMVGRLTRAEAGLVDLYETAEERKQAIANSSKPFGIILDCAGLWQDHKLPDQDHNWERYFRGARAFKNEKKKEEEEIEVLVYVVEDSEGNRSRTPNVKEIEGQKLVEITTEVRRKIINLKAIKEFERIFAILKNQRQIKKPGYMAFKQYQEFCSKENILMVPEVWDVLERRLILEPEKAENDLIGNRGRFPSTYPQHLYDKSMERIKGASISKTFFAEAKRKYARENADQIAEYVVKHSQNVA